MNINILQFQMYYYKCKKLQHTVDSWMFLTQFEANEQYLLGRF